MMRRYAHFSTEHPAPYADRLWALRALDDPVAGAYTAQAVNNKGPAYANPLIYWRA